MKELNKTIKNTKNAKNKVLAFLFLLAASLPLGIACGFVGALFYKIVAFATNIRTENFSLIYLLPLLGVIIVLFYKVLKINAQNTDTAFLEAKGENKLSVLLLPGIFIASFLTHLGGGSAGKEGAALQIGASVGKFFSNIFKLDNEQKKVLLIAGMGASFAAVFTTPFTAAIFALTVINIKKINLKAVIPTFLSSFIAYFISIKLGIHKMGYSVVNINYNFNTFLKVLLIIVLAAIISVIFVISAHGASSVFKKIFKNKYLIIIIGAVIVILLTHIFGTDYNGTGINIIENTFLGKAKPEAFLLKIIFTSITIGCGFKGGEIVPSFFIGSTFGAYFSSLLNISPSLGAAVGIISLFCGVTNAPIAAFILSLEIFGFSGGIYYLLAALLTYLITEKYSLYSSQEKFLYKKREL